MTQTSVFVAVHLYDDREVEHIIFSAGYEGAWERERDLKLRVFDMCNIPRERVHCIGPITSSYDEVEGIRGYISKLRAAGIIVVAEEYHAPRAEMVVVSKFPNLQVEVKCFKTERFEKTFEPHPLWILGKLKSLRAGYKWSWRLWNFIFEFLTSLMLRKDKPKR